MPIEGVLFIMKLREYTYCAENLNYKLSNEQIQNLPLDFISTRKAL